MKKVVPLIIVLLLSACAQMNSSTSPTSTQVKVLSGPYLGQALPGSEPVTFGDLIFKGGYHSSPTFLPDGSEVYWGGVFSSVTIYTMKQINGVWGNQQVLELPGHLTKIRDPFISPDGTTLYFITAAPLPGSTEYGKENIWMTKREEESWGVPEPLPEIINSFDLHWTVSVASNGNLYFSSGNGGVGDIYISEFVEGKYSTPTKLPFPVNDEVKIETTPNIAPDESYILFSRMDTTESTPRLFISYASSMGWTDPVLVENVSNCVSPMVTPDRMYVFCTAGPYKVEWRDTSFINEYRPK